MRARRDRTAPTAADKVFSEIAADILSGAFRPRDEISERDLVERYGVSRTPVREAIKRLFERGFLEAGRKRVAVVKEITGKEVQDLYQLRLLLEAGAARQTAQHITPEELGRLREINREFIRAYEARDLARMLDVRAQFHAVLVQATRNRWLAEVLITLRDQAYVVRHAHWQDAKRAGETIRMHRDMIEALAAGRAAPYRAIVLRQIRSGLETYLSRLRTAPRPPGRAPSKRASRHSGDTQ